MIPSSAQTARPIGSDSPKDRSALLARYGTFLATLSAERVEQMGRFIAADVHFKDPFNDCRGLGQMQAIFAHMYDTLPFVRFTLLDQIDGQPLGALHWRFCSQLRGKAWQFDGVSLIGFNRQGEVNRHIDYWDAGSDFYGQLPVLGAAIGWVRGKLKIG